LSLLKALALWSLNSSEAVQAIIKESYKQTRRDDDRNQPRSVQPWFSDQYRRKYWLIEGQDDSHFRIYRENDGKTAKTNTWFSVAESIPDVIALADKFAEEHTSNSKVISDKLRAAIPRFEVGEEVGIRGLRSYVSFILTILQKRRRRDYRIARKAAFARPDPGFSLYEGRTRGKRMRYTYSDDDFGSDETGRRSARNSGISTPLETGPTVTASGRQVKSRVGGVYGETMLVDQRKELERAAGEGHLTETSEDMPTTMANSRGMRTSRSGRQVKPPRPRYGDAGGSDESDEAQSSGKEWSGNEDEPDESEPDFDGEDEDQDEDMDEEVSGDDVAEEDDNTQESLVVQLRYRKGEQRPASTTAPTAQPLPSHQQAPPSNGISVVVNGTKPAKPPQAPDVPTMGDTTEMAPRVKLVNGTSGNNSPHYPLPQAPRPVVEIPVHSMDVS
jgi:hypothetical protein